MAKKKNTGTAAAASGKKSADKKKKQTISKSEEKRLKKVQQKEAEQRRKQQQKLRQQQKNRTQAVCNSHIGFINDKNADTVKNIHGCEYYKGYQHNVGSGFVCVLFVFVDYPAERCIAQLKSPFLCIHNSSIAYFPY